MIEYISLQAGLTSGTFTLTSRVAGRIMLGGCSALLTYDDIPRVSLITVNQKPEINLNVLF